MSKNDRARQIGDQLLAAIRNGDADTAADELLKLAEESPEAADKISQSVIVNGLHKMTGL